MGEPNEGGAPRRVLPWALLAIAGGCLAVTAAAIAMVARPGPVAVAKSEAVAACHDALADGNSGVTEERITEESVYTSMDWQDYQRAIEAYGYGEHTPVDERSADDIAGTDAFYTQLRGVGEETVWVVWEIDGDNLWQCEVRLLEGEILGVPMQSSPPKE